MHSYRDDHTQPSLDMDMICLKTTHRRSLRLTRHHSNKVKINLKFLPRWGTVAFVFRPPTEEGFRSVFANQQGTIWFVTRIKTLRASSCPTKREQSSSSCTSGNRDRKRGCYGYPTYRSRGFGQPQNRTWGRGTTKKRIHFYFQAILIQHPGRCCHFCLSLAVAMRKTWPRLWLKIISIKRKHSAWKKKVYSRCACEI